MNVYIKGHKHTTPMLEIVHAMTGEKALLTDDISAADVISIADENTVTTTIVADGTPHTLSMELKKSDFRNEAQSNMDNVKRCYYLLASKLYNKTLPWGHMTGIRPAKIALSYENKHDYMNDFCLSEEKASLAFEVAENSLKIENNINKDDISIYIGIPFCPTRCLYCSFVSLPMDKQKKYVEPYVRSLCREIEYTGKIIKGKRINTVYIGGGTPTSLSAEQLDMILKSVNNNFEIKEEFTVEAGRPDTITKEKLDVLKSAGVTRISINPQTMNDEILEKIGRKHTEKMFLEAYETAVTAGFDNINTDVIAGLPEETSDMFLSSLEKIVSLNPASVTIHAMCIKRSSQLKTKINTLKTYSPEIMVNSGYKLLKEHGLHPYYMYRQKDTLSNLENTGYAKKGFECIYNIFMMEDIGTVIGIGAGSVSKIVKGNRIERVFNLKDAYEYVKSFDKIIRRKDETEELLK